MASNLIWHAGWWRNECQNRPVGHAEGLPEQPWAGELALCPSFSPRDRWSEESMFKFLGTSQIWCLWSFGHQVFHSDTCSWVVAEIPQIVPVNIPVVPWREGYFNLTSTWEKIFTYSILHFSPKNLFLCYIHSRELIIHLKLYIKLRKFTLITSSDTLFHN